MGSFGAVWAAEVRQGGTGEVAIKEIQCHNQAELANAQYEGRLLQMLQERGGASGSSLRQSRSPSTPPGSQGAGRDERIPALVAQETELVGPDFWRVRLAMTKVPGVPLDRFLDWWQRERSMSTDNAFVQRQRFAEACHFARALVAQLVPTFENISALAYHRDVNSHNILVDGGDGMGPCFGLVDFGLAADLPGWRGPMGPSSWHLVDIGGDCRYWPMSAWLQFECGWQELSKYQVLAVEYQTQLDMHAFGITTLQVLAAMCPMSTSTNPTPGRLASEAGRVGFGGGAGGETLPDEVRALQAAWDRYWQDMTRFWERLLDVFRNNGDQNALKGSCIVDGVHNVVGQNLAVLRSTIREVCDACGRAPASAGLRAARPLFAALLELVSAGGVTGVEEGGRPPSWQAIRELIETADDAAGPV